MSAQLGDCVDCILVEEREILDSSSAIAEDEEDGYRCLKCALECFEPDGHGGGERVME